MALKMHILYHSFLGGERIIHHTSLNRHLHPKTFSRSSVQSNRRLVGKGRRKILANTPGIQIINSYHRQTNFFHISKDLYHGVVVFASRKH